MKRMIAMLLLLGMCLSMWGCSSNSASATQPTQRPNKPSSSASSQRPNNNNSSNNNSSTKIDQNGFSSLEQLVGVYVAMQTGTATRNQLYKLYPEKYWGQYADFDQFYSDFLTNADNTKESLKKQYGANYKVTYQIINSEVATDYSNKNIDKKQNQEFKEAYGVDMKERCDYGITISITISGSITEKATRSSVYFKKIGTKWYG